MNKSQYIIERLDTINAEIEEKMGAGSKAAVGLAAGAAGAAGVHYKDKIKSHLGMAGGSGGGPKGGAKTIHNLGRLARQHGMTPQAFHKFSSGGKK